MDAALTTPVVQIIVEERRELHRQRRNKEKIQPTFEIGDVVNEHVQVKSDADQGEEKNSHIKHEDHSKFAKILT